MQGASGMLYAMPHQFIATSATGNVCAVRYVYRTAVQYSTAYVQYIVQCIVYSVQTVYSVPSTSTSTSTLGDQFSAGVDEA